MANLRHVSQKKYQTFMKAIYCQNVPLKYKARFWDGALERTKWNNILLKEGSLLQKQTENGKKSVSRHFNTNYLSKCFALTQNQSEKRCKRCSQCLKTSFSLAFETMANYTIQCPYLAVRSLNLLCLRHNLISAAPVCVASSATVPTR